MVSRCAFFLVLVSILRGLLPGFAGLTGVSQLGKNHLVSFFFLFGMVESGYFSMFVSGFRLELDIITQLMPTGWQAGVLKDRPFSTISLPFYFMFASPTLSIHNYITSCTIFFCLLLNKSFQKSNENILGPSNKF